MTRMKRMKMAAALSAALILVSNSVSKAAFTGISGSGWKLTDGRRSPSLATQSQRDDDAHPPPTLRWPLTSDHAGPSRKCNMNHNRLRSGAAFRLRSQLGASDETGNHSPPQDQPHTDDFAVRVAKAVQPSVALVTPIGVRNMTSRGTGFVVDFDDGGDDDGHDDADGAKHVFLLTAAHVATPGSKIEVYFPGDRTITPPDEGERGGGATWSDGENSRSATVVDRDVGADLALIRIEWTSDEEGKSSSVTASPPAASPPPPPLQICDDRPSVGTLSFAHGYPGGVEGPAMTSGIVCAFAKGLGYDYFNWNRGGRKRGSQMNNATNSQGEDEEVATTNPQGRSGTSFVVTDAAMAGGMSGGPLVDVGGRVVGVNALVRPDLRALGNYAVDASECRAFLKRVSLRIQEERSLHSGGGGVRDGASSSIAGYRVVIYNDPMNKRARVAKVLAEVAGLNETASNESMMEAHTTGRGVVREFDAFDADSRAVAEELCNSLRGQDVLAEVERILAAQ